jgi:hypothetical protein
MIKNEHLIPEIIFNVVEKFKVSTNQNEKLNLQFRLEAIRDYVSESLESKPVRDVFRGMKKQGNKF